MVPLLWLLSASFKTADEVFAVPIRWFPKLPPRVTSSPYIVTNAYPKIKKPTSVDPKAWKTLQTELERAIWRNTQEHIAINPQFVTSNFSEDLQTEMTEGIWQQHVATLPPEVWSGTTESIVKEVENAIIPETIETIWNSVYRQVNLGTIEIEDIEFNRMEVESAKWEADSDTLKQIFESDVPEPIAALSYDYQDKNNVRLTTTISSPVPIDRIRRVILPIRGDASYHHLSLSVSVNGTIYQPTHPFVLDTALQEDTVWRLHGIPGELESSHIPMQQVEANDETIKPDIALETDAENRLFLKLTIHRPAYLAIVWNKLTSNYRNLSTAFLLQLRQPFLHYFFVRSVGMRLRNISFAARQSCSVSCWLL